MIKVALVDDHVVVRSGFFQLILKYAMNFLPLKKRVNVGLLPLLMCVF